MNKTDITEQGLFLTTFVQRENSLRHHSYDEEMLPYEYLKNGDLTGVELASKIFQSDSVGKVSDNPLRCYKYLFVACATLTTRFAIEGGLEGELAYTLSDMYINRVDRSYFYL